MRALLPDGCLTRQSALELLAVDAIVTYAFEAAAAIITAALARKAVERFLSGEPPSGHPTLDAVGTIGGAAEPDRPKTGNGRAPAPREDYSGMSASRVP